MAKIIAFGKSYEILSIELGDATVTARIDLRDSTIDKNFKILRSKRVEAERLMAKQDALESKDGPEADGLAKGMAAIIAPAIIAAIGEESYNEILAACGDGDPVEPEEANMLMTLVFAEIEAVMVERFKAFRGSKAAHYLQELNNAQPEANRD